MPNPLDDDTALQSYAAGLQGPLQHQAPPPPNLGKAIAGGIVGTVKNRIGAMEQAFSLPHDVMTGQVDPLSDQGIDRTLQLTGMLTRGGMAGAEENAAGIFGGRLAKTAPKEGLFMGAEGMRRFEINDAEAKYIQPPPPPPFKPAPDRDAYHNYKDWAKAVDVHYDEEDKKAIRLKDALHHPKLFEAYPEIANIPYKEEDLGNTYGTFGSGGIIINKNISPDEKRSVLLHEIQHWVQKKEGFARGGAVPRVNPPPEVLERVRKAAETNPDAIPALEDLERKVKSLSYDAYNNLMGETEARNVQYRRNLSDVHRDVIHPWETEDVPRSQQTYTLNPVDFDPWAK